MGTRVFSLLQKGISSAGYFVRSLAPYGSPLLIFFHTRTLCSDALVNILPSKHKQDAKIAVDSNLLLNYIATLTAKASFSKGFTKHMPHFFFPLGVQAGPFNCLSIKQDKQQTREGRFHSLPAPFSGWSKAALGAASYKLYLCTI